MTQAQLIDKLNDLMPEISQTRQPEKVMLKFAREHKLAPAQLEKLGHIFNTTKTIVGLTKMANRGDSFSLVDVPAMVRDYSTYSAEDVLSREDKQVHKEVNKLMKEAYVKDGWARVLEQPVMSKSASSDEIKPGGSMPDTLGRLVDAYYAEKGGVHEEDVSDGENYLVIDGSVLKNDIMHKRASVSGAAAVKVYDKVSDLTSRAYDEFEQIVYEAKCDVREKCAAIREKFLGQGALWAEAKEDIWDSLQEKSAEAIQIIENYFDDKGFVYAKHDLEKRAFVPAISRDRHGVVGIVEDMIGVLGVYKQASAVLEKVAGPNPPPPPRLPDQIPDSILTDTLVNVAPNMVTSVSDEASKGADKPFLSGVAPASPTEAMSKTFKALDGLLPTKNKRQEQIDEDLRTVDEDIVLQRLLLADPIISEAEPDKVQAIFRTIASVSPRAAKDPMIVGPVLKEALQYESLPIHMLKDLADFEKTTTQTAGLHTEQNKDKYSIRSAFKA